MLGFSSPDDLKFSRSAHIVDTFVTYYYSQNPVGITIGNKHLPPFWHYQLKLLLKTSHVEIATVSGNECSLYKNAIYCRIMTNISNYFRFSQTAFSAI